MWIYGRRWGCGLGKGSPNCWCEILLEHCRISGRVLDRPHGQLKKGGQTSFPRTRRALRKTDLNFICVYNVFHTNPCALTSHVKRHGINLVLYILYVYIYVHILLLLRWCWCGNIRRQTVIVQTRQELNSSVLLISCSRASKKTGLSWKSCRAATPSCLRMPVDTPVGFSLEPTRNMKQPWSIHLWGASMLKPSMWRLTANI